MDTATRIHLHPRTVERLRERGATYEEALATVELSERFPAKYGRIGFRRNYSLEAEWNGRRHSTKQNEAYCV